MELLKDVVAKRGAGFDNWTFEALYRAVESEPPTVGAGVVYFPQPNMQIYWRYWTANENDEEIMREFARANFNQTSVFYLDSNQRTQAIANGYTWYHVRG